MTNNSYDMIKNDFIDKIENNLKAKYGALYDVEREAVIKNNNIEKTAIVIRKKGNNIAPLLYIEDDFNDYVLSITKGENPDYIIDNVVEKYYEVSQQALKKQPDKILDKICKNWIYENVCFDVINKEKNHSRLEQIPHLDFLDLAVTFRVNVRTENDIRESLLVDNNIMKHYNLEIQDLLSSATENTKKFNNFTCESLFQKLFGSFYNIEDDYIWILSSADGIKGASVVLYPEYMKSLAEKMQSDLIILPSSIHEVLVVKKDETMSIDDYRNMVIEVNTKEVSEEEILSSNVYFYNRKNESLEIAV